MSRAVVGKLLISVFILWHFVLWGWRQFPEWATWRAWNAIDATMPTPLARGWRWAPVVLNWYGHKAGLDNKWEMYSSLVRGDWTIIASGIDANGKRILLPEPLQTSRTWFEREVVDFREPKYQIHLLRWPAEQRRYANYLLRRYPRHNDVPIQSIVLEMQFRPFVVNTYEAERTGSHFAGPAWSAMLYPPPVIPPPSSLQPSPPPPAPVPVPTPVPATQSSTSPSTTPAAATTSEVTP